MQVFHYLTERGVDIFQEWLDALPDQRGRIAILRRVSLLQLGHFGDSQSVGGSVHELRIDYASGYRVYYGRDGREVILLLCAGNKRTQKKDIMRAIEYWHTHKERK